MPQRFLITGASSGLGRELATAALADGHTVIGTLVKAEHVAAFEALAPGRARAALLDLAHLASIRPAVAHLERVVGPIDVVIHTAEHGVEGTYEETPLVTLREHFETNVFGTTALTQALLPGMRTRGSGSIVFVTTVGGMRALAGLSAYHGTKYALEGMADALRQEVAPLGIRVMCVEPGLLHSRDPLEPVRIPTELDDYARALAGANGALDDARASAEPTSVASAVMAALRAEDPPAHLVIGDRAAHLVASARAAVEAEFDAWRDLTHSASLVPGEARSVGW